MKFVPYFVFSILLASCSAIPISISTRTPLLSATNTVTASVPVTIAPTSTFTPKPTFTSYPTYTLLPTYTKYPTYTPYPRNTAYPTYTALPSLTPWPTYTLYPTYTDVPTSTLIPSPSEVMPGSETPEAIFTPTSAIAEKLVTQKRPGVYLVNEDIAPGIWRSLGSGDGCYWEITTKTGDLINNYYGLAGGTMYIKPDAFQVKMKPECGDWMYLGQ